MASASVTLSPPRHVARHLLRWLGGFNGGLVGLALAAGAWGQDAASAGTLPIIWIIPSLILGTALLAVIGSVAGRLTVRLDNALAGALIWLAAALLMVWIIGEMPYAGRTWTIWLMDTRFWGLPIFTADLVAQARMIAGFFVALCLTLFGAMQPDQLESVLAALTPAGRLTGKAVLLLAWPLLFVFATGWLMDENINRPLRSAVQAMHTAIPVARTYPGDLVAYGRQQGFNYGALNAVRGQLGERYTLMLTQIELNPGAGQTVKLTAAFDNGAWINCEYYVEALAFCEDARPPYFQFFPALLAGAAPPQDLQVNVAWRAWLRERGAKLGATPRVSRLAQWGAYVLMRLEAPDPRTAIECLFTGPKPVTLEHCAEVAP